MLEPFFEGRMMAGSTPLTLQDPATLEIYIPFTMSPATIEWSPKRGFIS